MNVTRKKDDDDGRERGEREEIRREMGRDTWRERGERIRDSTGERKRDVRRPVSEKDLGEREIGEMADIMGRERRERIRK